MAPSTSTESGYPDDYHQQHHYTTTTTKGKWNVCTTGNWDLSKPAAWRLSDPTPPSEIAARFRPGFTYGYGNGSYYYSNDKGKTWLYSDGQSEPPRKKVKVVPIAAVNSNDNISPPVPKCVSSQTIEPKIKPANSGTISLETPQHVSSGSSTLKAPKPVDKNGTTSPDTVRSFVEHD